MQGIWEIGNRAINHQPVPMGSTTCPYGITNQQSTITNPQPVPMGSTTCPYGITNLSLWDHPSSINFSAHQNNYKLIFLHIKRIAFCFDIKNFALKK